MKTICEVFEDDSKELIEHDIDDIRREMNLSLGHGGKPLFEVLQKNLNGAPAFWVLKNGADGIVKACGVFDSSIEAEQHKLCWLDWAILTSGDRYFFLKSGLFTLEIGRIVYEH